MYMCLLAVSSIDPSSSKLESTKQDALRVEYTRWPIDRHRVKRIYHPRNREQLRLVAWPACHMHGCRKPQRRLLITDGSTNLRRRLAKPSRHMPYQGLLAVVSRNLDRFSGPVSGRLPPNPERVTPSSASRALRVDLSSLC